MEGTMNPTMKPVRNRMRLVAGLGAAMLSLGLAACSHGSAPQAVDLPYPPGSTMDQLHRAGTIRIGVKEDQPYVGFVNPATSKRSGFDIDIAKIVAAGLGLRPGQIRYVKAVSADREKYLTSGRVDLVIASYSITAARRRQVGQAGPYYQTGQQLLVRTADKHKITGPDKLHGVTVCSVAGATSSETMQKYHARLLLEPDYTQCVQQLLSKKVDAVTTDGEILHGYADLQAKVQPNQLTVVGKPFTTERYGIGYKKGDRAFCQVLTDIITVAEHHNRKWDKAFKDTLGKAGVGYQQPPPLDHCQE